MCSYVSRINMVRPVCGEYSVDELLILYKIAVNNIVKTYLIYWSLRMHVKCFVRGINTYNVSINYFVYTMSHVYNSSL